MLKRKLSVKTLNGKCKALKNIEKGLSNKDASKKYGVLPNKIATWIKNKEKYFKALEDNCSSKKRCSSIPIDGNLIKEKALTYAKELGYNNFHGTAGLLDRWKKR